MDVVPDSSSFGRLVHFGVREHAMGAALSGMAIGGLTRPLWRHLLHLLGLHARRRAVAAIMKVPVTYVWTHDSIGVGEDGPTHQPIEHLASLRAMPQIAIVRPADANEVAIAWRTIMERSELVGLILSRQTLPTIDRSVYGSAEGVAKGGYVVSDCDGTPDVLLLATGSEVPLALDSQKALAADGIAARVVSLPCFEWFFEQDGTTATR